MFGFHAISETPFSAVAAAVAALKTAQSNLVAFGRSYARMPTSTTGFVGGIVAERPTSEQSIQTNTQINNLSFCKACRFLDWGYFSAPTSLGSANSLMGFWVDGLSATTVQLSRAASKRAQYSGDMVGVVSNRGDRQIKQ